MFYSKISFTDKFLFIFWVLMLFIYSCAQINPQLTTDSCILFKEKKFWYQDTKRSYDKWGTPISLQLAIVNQESSFKQFAKPERMKLFNLIPWKRPSSAFGYAQVIDPTWDWYKSKTGNKNASRANFRDITDFIGWYTNQSKNMLGIEKSDSYNQYLAYHEGQMGWKKKSYENKAWLIEAAKNVEKKSSIYESQLKKCETKLNKKGIFGFL